MISDRMDINRVLTEMRAIKAQTQSLQPQQIDKATPLSRQSLSVDGVKPTAETSDFGQLMDQAVNKVNDLQSTSKAMAIAYEKGQSGVNVTDVMIASQKAGVSFQAMLQVRNKLVEAYRDVMNMPV